jgi:hypothetical protein
MHCAARTMPFLPIGLTIRDQDALFSNNTNFVVVSHGNVVKQIPYAEVRQQTTNHRRAAESNRMLTAHGAKAHLERAYSTRVARAGSSTGAFRKRSCDLAA